MKMIDTLPDGRTRVIELVRDAGGHIIGFEKGVADRNRDFVPNPEPSQAIVPEDQRGSVRDDAGILRNPHRAGHRRFWGGRLQSIAQDDGVANAEIPSEIGEPAQPEPSRRLRLRRNKKVRERLGPAKRFTWAI